MNYLNFEARKMLIQNPDLSNGLIFFVLLCVAGITVIRTKTTFLDRTQTDQLKGIAILFVVTGHLWTHVSLHGAAPNFAGYAVSLFLLLSGYGLTRSWQKKPLTVKEFAERRIGRVMAPYWIATVCILLLDYLLLNRTYSISEIVSTMCGMNFVRSLRYLDYARWYITLIIIFYCIFYIANRLARPLAAIFLLFTFSLVLFVLRRMDIFPFGALHHFMAFPLGCLIASVYTPQRVAWINRKIPLVTLLFVSLIGAFLCEKYMADLPGAGIVVKLIELMMHTAQPLLLCLFLMTVVGLLGIFSLCSRFLVFCGTVSYEVYLLHGPLLIKYNLVFPYFSSDYIVIGYLVFLLFILVLSYLFKLFHEHVLQLLTG